jgi:hypothetical protein
LAASSASPATIALRVTSSQTASVRSPAR